MFEGPSCLMMYDDQCHALILQILTATVLKHRQEDAQFRKQSYLMYTEQAEKYELRERIVLWFVWCSLLICCLFSFRKVGLNIDEW